MQVRQLAEQGKSLVRGCLNAGTCGAALDLADIVDMDILRKRRPHPQTGDIVPNFRRGYGGKRSRLNDVVGMGMADCDLLRSAVNAPGHSPQTYACTNSMIMLAYEKSSAPVLRVSRILQIMSWCLHAVSRCRDAILKRHA